MKALNRGDRLFPGLNDIGTETERDLARLEPGWAKAAMFVRTGNRLGHGVDSMRGASLVEVHRILDVYRQRLEEDDTLSILQAIGKCAEENLPLPEWLALAFHKRITAFGRPGAPPSLDQVFYSKGIPTNSPKKAEQVRQDWQLGGLMWRDAWELAVRDPTITSFDRAVTCLLATKKYGVKKTKAKQLIEMVDNNQAQFLGSTETLPRFLEKRRKLMK